MNKDYNKEKHHQLLKYSKDLKKQGKFIGKESREDYLKLLSYSVKLSDHVHWQQKRDYLNIMKNFVDLKIDGKQFVSQFNELHQSNQEIVKMLKTDLKQLNTFQLNPKSFGFTEWTSGLLKIPLQMHL